MSPLIDSIPQNFGLGLALSFNDDEHNNTHNENYSGHSDSDYLQPLSTSASSSSSAPSSSPSSSSQPIRCPMMSYEHHEEMMIHEQEKTYYNSRTWSMYRRITVARSRCHQNNNKHHHLGISSSNADQQYPYSHLHPSHSHHDGVFPSNDMPSQEEEEIFHLEI